jgi:hypothetical protein
MRLFKNGSRRDHLIENGLCFSRAVHVEVQGGPAEAQLHKVSTQLLRGYEIGNRVFPVVPEPV